MANILRMRGIEKQFTGVKSLDCVDFDLEAGEIRALLGMNGAGKSTLIKIISGVYMRDHGSIEIDGETVELGTPLAAIEKGVASVPQHPELIDDYTGIENIYLGLESSRRGLFAPVKHQQMAVRAQELLKRCPVEIDLGRKVGDMAAVDREIVAILHALRSEDIKILILDEPTSTLTEREKASLFQLMRRLKSTGIAMIYITHHLEEVLEIADTLTVFRNGKNVGTHPVASAKSGKVSVTELMLNERLDEFFPPKTPEPGGRKLLEIKGLGKAGQYQNIGFTLHTGRILGIFGLIGSGAEELSHALFGVARPDSGEIILGNVSIALNSPSDALRQGIFMVPGDRRKEGLVMSENVVFNTVLGHLQKASAGGFITPGRNREQVAGLAERVGLQPPQLNKAVGTFSGGNQQKIVIAKGLYRNADIYIFVEPTVGVDIGAKTKLYSLMRELSKTAAVLLISSDCDEVFGVADETMALYKGRQVSFANGCLSREQLLSAGIMGA